MASRHGSAAKREADRSRSTPVSTRAGYARPNRRQPGISLALRARGTFAIHSVRLPRLPVLRLRDALPFQELGVDPFLVPQVKCERPGAQVSAQVGFDHAFGRHALTIDERIEGHTRVSAIR